MFLSLLFKYSVPTRISCGNKKICLFRKLFVNYPFLLFHLRRRKPTGAIERETNVEVVARKAKQIEMAKMTVLGYQRYIKEVPK